MTDSVTIYTPGHWDPYDSYGMIACELARNLDDHGVWVNAVALGNRVVDSQPEDVRRITSRPIRAGFGGVLLGYPTTFKGFTALSMTGPRIGITMFESTKLPDDWLEPLNDIDAVIVPSTFCRNVFINSGVTTTIYVVPLGVHEVFQPALRPANRKPYTFLAFLDRGRRKGGYHAMQAFLKAFGDREDVQLILKTRRPTDVPIKILNNNIHIIQKDMTPEELYDFYLQADVLINPNLGEGFGLIPREFAASGGVALATDWGGTKDDILKWGFPIVTYNLKPAWQGHRHEGAGLWADPDVDGLANLLLRIWKKRDEYRLRARQKAFWARNKYRWSTFASYVLTVWQRVEHDYRNTTKQAA